MSKNIKSATARIALFAIIATGGGLALAGAATADSVPANPVVSGVPTPTPTPTQDSNTPWG
ncbi:hypothetical protein [Sphaerisporangium rufum]|nr:hypothetical protein [Sphaerisporangium rufum]